MGLQVGKFKPFFNYYIILLVIVVPHVLILGIAGSMFLIFSGPIVIVAFLAIAHLIISGEKDLQRYVNL